MQNIKFCAVLGHFGNVYSQQSHSDSVDFGLKQSTITPLIAVCF